MCVCVHMYACVCERDCTDQFILDRDIKLMVSFVTTCALSNGCPGDRLPESR